MSFIAPDYYVITKIISKLIISTVITKKMIKSALKPIRLPSWSLSQILYHEVTIPFPPLTPGWDANLQQGFPLKILSTLFDHLSELIYNFYTVERFSTMNVKCLALALLNPTSDQNLTYPYSKTAQSFTKIMRIIEMMANQTSSDC